jgi:hypothetical protein
VVLSALNLRAAIPPGSGRTILALAIPSPSELRYRHGLVELGNGAEDLPNEPRRRRILDEGLRAVGRDQLVLAITAAVMALPVTRIVLDDEAVAHCPEGLPDFHALLGREGCARACLYAFDLLVVGAEDLRGLTLVERRALLREHLKHTGAAIIYSEHMEGADGEAMFRHACGLGLEGIVSKRATSRYRSGRCAAWVKVKNPAYERR